MWERGNEKGPKGWEQKGQSDFWLVNSAGGSVLIQHHVRKGNSLPRHFKTREQEKIFPPVPQPASGIHRSASSTASNDP